MSNTKETAIIVWTEHRNGYFHIHASVGYVKDTDAPEWPGRYSDDRKDGLRFDALRASSQGTDREYNGSTSERKLYGFGLHYQDIYTLELRDAEAFTKTLRTLQNRMAKLQEAQGYPKSFGQYLGQLAQAVKAKTFYIRQGEPGMEYRAGYSVADLIRNVDYLEQQWVKAGQPKPVEAREEVSA